MIQCKHVLKMSLYIHVHTVRRKNKMSHITQEHPVTKSVHVLCALAYLDISWEAFASFAHITIDGSARLSCTAHERLESVHRHHRGATMLLPRPVRLICLQLKKKICKHNVVMTGVVHCISVGGVLCEGCCCYA